MYEPRVDRLGDITTHYSAPELEELTMPVNKVCKEKSGKSPAVKTTGIRARQSVVL